jgi:hypothetical protein
MITKTFLFCFKSLEFILHTVYYYGCFSSVCACVCVSLSLLNIDEQGHNTNNIKFFRFWKKRMWTKIVFVANRHWIPGGQVFYFIFRDNSAYWKSSLSEYDCGVLSIAFMLNYLLYNYIIYFWTTRIRLSCQLLPSYRKILLLKNTFNDIRNKRKKVRSFHRHSFKIVFVNKMHAFMHDNKQISLLKEHYKQNIYFSANVHVRKLVRYK